MTPAEKQPSPVFLLFVYLLLIFIGWIMDAISFLIKPFRSKKK